MQNIYQAQVKLLLTCLPIVASVKSFALKGGTALNLFDRQDFPRLSVDLDLVYLPVEDRKTTLTKIEDCLYEIQNKLQQTFVELKIISIKNNITKTITKLTVARNKIAIKIEPNLILRGTVYPTRKLDVSKEVSAEYGMAVFDVPLVSSSDLYAGKMMAALDRQHPKDLFDIAYILKQEFTDELKTAFLIYLISHNRPIRELLQPNLLNTIDAYNNEFVGMTKIPVPYEALLITRKQLIEVVNKVLTKEDKEFLLSFKQGVPNWEHLEVANVEKLPAVAWKLLNIRKMEPTKHKQAIASLERVLFN